MSLPAELQPLATAVGWTLLHFVWQAALVGTATALALALLHRHGAAVRHGVCCLGLGVMLLLPVLTFAAVRASAFPLPSLSDVALSAGGFGLGSWNELLRASAPFVSVAWLSGVAVMQLRLVLQVLRLRLLRREGLSPLPGPWPGRVDALARRMGLRRAFAAVQSTRAAVPMVVGWLRPVVLLPASMLTGLPRDQVEAVLAHELAHVRRHDALVNLVQTVFESLFFFHPAVWWLSGRLRTEREFCCDDAAVAVCGDTLTYARALASLDAMRDEGAPALAATGGSLMHRITRLLGVRQDRVRGTHGWIFPAVATLLLSTAVSAMTLSPVTDDEVLPPVPSLDGVDVVQVVSHLDPERGQALGKLRDAGLSDTELFTLLTASDADPALAEAVYRAAHHRTLLRHYKEIRHRQQLEIKRGLRDGTITKQEAHDRLARLEQEGRVLVHSVKSAGKLHLVERIGEHAAHERHVEVPVDTVIEITPVDEISLERVELHEHMRAIETEAAEVHGALERGEITAAEAKTRMKAIQSRAKELHFGPDVRHPGVKNVKKRLQRVHEERAAKIERAVKVREPEPEIEFDGR